MLKHSFSDFSYAVNFESAKKGKKEILVCYMYNGTEVLKKVYIPEGPGVSYIFEAKKVIDQEMRDGTLAAYSHKFVARNKKKNIQPKKVVAAVNAGKPMPVSTAPKGGSKKWIIVAGCTVAVAALVLGTYFATKSLIKPAAEECAVSFETSEGCNPQGPKVVEIGKKYECTFIPDADKSVSIDYVKMGDKDTEYTFADNLLTIDKVTDTNISIKAHTTPLAYKVTFNGVGCTSSGLTSVPIGVEYECDITSDRTTETPIISKIFMNSTLLTDSDYTFNGSHLHITKPASGNIDITAGVETTTFNVTCDAPAGVTFTGLSTIKKGAAYDCSIVTSVEKTAVAIDAVRMGGKLLDSQKDYNYSESSSRLVINKIADGDINIVVSLKATIYDVNYHLTYCELKDEPIINQIKAGGFLTCEFKEPGGTRENMVTGVTMGGIDLVEGSDADYVFENNILTLKVGATGNIVVSAMSYEPTQDRYDVTVENGEGCNPVDPAEVVPGESYECGLYVEDSTNKKVHIDAVVMGGTSLKEGEGYTFNKDATSGNNFTINKVVGNVLIKFEAIDIGDVSAIPTYKTSTGGDYLIVDGFTVDGGKAAKDVQVLTVPAEAESPTTNETLPVREIDEGAFNELANLEEISLPFIGRKKLADGEDPRDGSQLFGYIFGDTPHAGGATTWQTYYDIEGVSHPRKAIIPISLKRVTITGDDKIVNAGAFSGCRSVQEISFTQNAATAIKNCAFYGCTSLKNAAIPGSVTAIEESAFENCTTLQHIDMPSNLGTIANYAFRECQSLYKVYLSNTIEQMGTQAFTNIRGGVVACQRTKKQVESAEFWSDQWVDVGTSVVYGAIGTEDYVDSEEEFHYMLVKNDDAETGAYVAEYVGDTKAEEITIPETIKENASAVAVPVFGLGDYTFSEFTLTKKFIFNCTSLTTIGSYCFAFCEKLTTLENFENLNNLTSIGAYSLGATAIASISIPNSVELIGEYAFAYDDFTECDLSGCTKLKKISEGLFYYCYSMEVVTLPEGITYLGENIFEGCSKLTSLKLNTIDVDTIPYALCYCTADVGSALESFTWESSTPLKSIGGSAFGGCYNMASFIVNNGTTTTTNTIPNTVTNFGDYAFVRCTSITQLTIPAATPVQDITMGLEVFKGWTSSQTLRIAQNLTSGAGIGRTEVTTNWGWNLSRGISLDWYHFNCRASGSESLVVYVNG